MSALVTEGGAAGYDIDAGASCHIRVRLRFATLLADEEAINGMLCSKGASGGSPCVLCCVVNKQCATDRDGGLLSLADRDGSIADISCPVLDLCCPKSNDDIWRSVERLRSAAPASRAELEHLLGLKYNEDSLLFCRELKPMLRPAECVFYDTLHILFSNGIVVQEIALVMQALKDDFRIEFGNVRDFLQEKQFHPKTMVFSEVRERTCNHSLSAGASESMEAYVILRAFLVENFGPDPPEPYLKCFLVLGDICDIIRILLRWPAREELEVHVAALKELIEVHLEYFTKLYGRDSVKFKHHQLLHLPMMILFFKCLLSCFVLERKHIHAKMSCEHLKKYKHLEKSSLSRLLSMQVSALQCPEKAPWSSRLLSIPKQWPELAADFGCASVEVSSSMNWNGLHLQSKDVMCLGSGMSYVAVIVACLQCDKSYALLVRVCRCAKMDDWKSKWNVEPSLSACRLRGDEAIFKPMFKRYVDADIIEILH